MNYYKITNEEELHNGMQYHDGLNEDILPFNPSGSCKPGGIHFAREDIFAFLSYGPWIRKVTIPEGEEIYKNPGKPIKYKAHKVFLHQRRKIDSDVIKELVEEGANIHVSNDYHICQASAKGRLELVKCLVENGADIHANNEYPLRFASYQGHFETVKYLVEKGADISVIDDYDIYIMAVNRNFKIIEYLTNKMEEDKGDKYL